VDLDAFWEEALETETGGENMNGLSFDEAMRQGLVSFDEKEEAAK
jgi:hypothetical protein